MPTEPDDQTHQADTADALARHDADREPTRDEERVADEEAAASDPSVGEHFDEMTKIGVDARGEGRIEP